MLVLARNSESHQTRSNLSAAVAVSSLGIPTKPGSKKPNLKSASTVANFSSKTPANIKPFVTIPAEWPTGKRLAANVNKKLSSLDLLSLERRAMNGL